MLEWLKLVFYGSTPQLSDACNEATAVNGAPEDHCVASLRRFLSTHSSRFEQLILISYLCDSNGDKRLSSVPGEFRDSEVIAGLRKLHVEMFLAWLNLSPIEGQADIRAYLTDPDDGAYMLAALGETGRSVIPSEAKPHEAQLFTHDLEMIQLGLGGQALGNTRLAYNDPTGARVVRS
jgi:hypothetical protein